MINGYVQNTYKKQYSFIDARKEISTVTGIFHQTKHHFSKLMCADKWL